MITVLNILLIEDNPGDIRLLQEILREVTTTRCRITPVMTLAEAIEQLALVERKAAKGLEHSRFDAILLDLSLPDSQGLSSFLTLHQRDANIPIIVLTGLDDQNLAISAM
jgi:CheY-like chemotaxis protein